MTALLFAMIVTSRCRFSSEDLSWKCMPSDQRQRCSNSITSPQRWKRRRSSVFVNRGRKKRLSWCLLGTMLHAKQQELMSSVSQASVSSSVGRRVGKKKKGGSLGSCVISRTLLSWILNCSRRHVRNSIPYQATGCRHCCNFALAISATLPMELPCLSTSR